MLDISKIAEKKGKTEFAPLDEGTYPARVVRIIDLGLQVQKDWKTGEIKLWENSGKPVIYPKIWVDFELPTEMITIKEEEKPRWLGREFTVSSSEKAAIKALITATGCGSNISMAIGKPVMVQVGHTQSGKAKVTNVMPIMKGLTVPPLVNSPVIFDLDDPSPDAFDILPEFLKNMIIPHLPQGFITSPPVESNGGGDTQKETEVSSSSSFNDDIPF